MLRLDLMRAGLGWSTDCVLAVDFGCSDSRDRPSSEIRLRSHQLVAAPDPIDPPATSLSTSHTDDMFVEVTSVQWRPHPNRVSPRQVAQSALSITTNGITTSDPGPIKISSLCPSPYRASPGFSPLPSAQLGLLGGWLLTFGTLLVVK